MNSIYSERLKQRNFGLDLYNNVGIYDDNNELGEITGDQYHFNDINKGMPIMGNFTPSKNDKKIIQSKELDFELFDKKTNFNVKYFDTTGENLAHINNTNELNTLMTNDLDKMSNIIDNYGCFLFNNILNYGLKNNFLITSYNLISILICLYLSSSNKTTTELRNYLNLSDKQKCITEFGIYNNELYKLSYFNVCNFLIIPNNYNVNKTFLNSISNMKLITYNNTNLDNETIKINNYISNYFNLKLDSIKPYHLNNKSIISLTTGKIEPQWSINFDDIICDTFFGFKKRNINFLLAKNKNYYYSSYNTTELIELRTYDNKMSFGIITTTENYYPNLTTELINLLVDNLEITTFKYLMIPQIKELIKFRYTNILKNLGLQNIFANLDIPDLVNNTVKLDDIVQNILLVINKNTNTQNIQHKKTHNSIAKKITTPFIYYLRLNTVNTILCVGQYC